MIPSRNFIGCLLLAYHYRHVPGLVVECGVWRGGMIAALAEALGPSRDYYLFDSFEGLPEPTERDGEKGKQWLELEGVRLNNCAAEIGYAREAMQMAGVPKSQIVKGWFSETLPRFEPTEPIAVLRLDADLYDSTMDCLTNLYPHVAPGGLVIFDDYFSWDGCAKALHDFLSQTDLRAIIREAPGGVTYLVKR